MRLVGHGTEELELKLRKINVKDVGNLVRDAVQKINFDTPLSIMTNLRNSLRNEPSISGQAALDDIIQNREIATQRKIPMCQDTGMIMVFVEYGQHIHFVGGSLREAIIRGVKEGSQEGYLRKSVVAEPLFERKNTGDNTPPVMHFDIIDEDKLRLIIAAKGFGAENMSWAKVLTPAEGIDGVKQEVIRCVEEAGPNACPPVVVGVGLGGTLEIAALLAKKALMREIGQRNLDQRYAALELELLDLVNATGIGPQGWGGANTALDVRIEFYPTHIAGIPLAVNLDCHLQRHIELII